MTEFLLPMSKPFIPYQWLNVETEESARQLMDVCKADVSQLPLVFFPDGAHLTRPTANEVARQLLEREGYAPVRKFWRIVIEMDESVSKSYQRGKLKVDLDLDSHRLAGANKAYEREGLYVVRQYHTYEKELRAGERLRLDEEWDGLPLVV